MAEELRFGIVVDGAGNLRVIDQAGDSVEKFGENAALAAAAQEELRKQIVLLNGDLADAQKAFRGLAVEETKARREAAANIAGLQQQRGSRSSSATSPASRIGQPADERGEPAPHRLRAGGNDSQQFAYGFRQGLVAVSNQVDGLAFGLQRLNQDAQASGRTLGGELLQSLKGPAGMIRCSISERRPPSSSVASSSRRSRARTPKRRRRATTSTASSAPSWRSTGPTSRSASTTSNSARPSQASRPG